MHPLLLIDYLFLGQDEQGKNNDGTLNDEKNIIYTYMPDLI